MVAKSYLILSITVFLINSIRSEYSSQALIQEILEHYIVWTVLHKTAERTSDNSFFH